LNNSLPIKGVIFDLDNTLLDFMKMKEVAVKSAIRGMIEAGLEADEIESFKDRHQAIMTQIKSILEMDENTLKKKLLDIKDKIHYNKRHLLECRDDVDIFKIAKQIDDIS